MVFIFGMVVSLKTDLRFPVAGQQGHGSRNIHCVGYLTFWYTNVLTELSDGNIEVWSWRNGEDEMAVTNLTNVNQTYEWLQLTSHKNTHPDGTTFMLFAIDEFQNINWINQLDTGNVIYQSHI